MLGLLNALAAPVHVIIHHPELVGDGVMWQVVVPPGNSSQSGVGIAFNAVTKFDFVLLWPENSTRAPRHLKRAAAGCSIGHGLVRSPRRPHLTEHGRGDPQRFDPANLRAQSVPRHAVKSRCNRRRLKRCTQTNGWYVHIDILTPPLPYSPCRQPLLSRPRPRVSLAGPARSVKVSSDEPCLRCRAGT